jgi:ribosomal protein S18 acetylase RimI-like enzyme
MIRETKAADSASILLLIVDAGLFDEGETVEVGQMLAAHFAGPPTSNEIWLTDDEDGPVGVAFVALEKMTEGTWNLLMLAVGKAHQSQGRGSALLRTIEQKLVAHGARILLVETSGTDGFESARQFYAKCGFEEEACIRDFYSAGNDKIVFRKRLS